jgi:hypothetical protein
VKGHVPSPAIGEHGRRSRGENLEAEVALVEPDEPRRHRPLPAAEPKFGRRSGGERAIQHGVDVGGSSGVDQLRSGSRGRVTAS